MVKEIPSSWSNVVINQENLPTRADIRRLEKEKKKTGKTLNMTVASFESSLKAARAEERKKVCEFTVHHYSAAVAMIMHDKWGFGQARLAGLIEQINDMYESIALGYVKVEDIRQTIFDETGLILK